MSKSLNKIFISVLALIVCSPVFADNKRFVSISPAMTDIMYELGAEDMLFGVSEYCDTKGNDNKEKIGSYYALNEEKILKIKPDYILALDSSEFMLNKFKRLGILPLCFKYPDIESVYNNILSLGKLTGKETRAREIINFSRKKIENAKKNNLSKDKKILYLMQIRPMISATDRSFIGDIVYKSGNKLVTNNIKTAYPVISEEYAVLSKPDVVVLSYYCRKDEVEKFFPNTRIVQMTKEENDIINRPGPNIYKAVEFFANL